MADGTDAALQKITKGAGIVFLGTMLQLALAFFAKAIMARFLEIPQYGLVSLGILVLNVGATVALLGLDNGIPRFLPRYDTDAQRRRIVRSSYGIALPVALVVAVLVYALAGEISTLVFDDPSLAPVLRVMAVGVPFWVLLDLGVGVTRGVEDARPRVYAKNLLLPGSRFVLVAIVALLGLGIAGMATAYVLSYALAAVLVSYLVVERVGIAAGGDAAGVRRQLLTFSAPLMFGGMSSFLVRNVDIVLLGILRDPGQVGVYNVAYPLARLLTTAPGAFSFLFLPVVSNLHAEDRMAEAGRVFQLTAKWLFLLTVPLFVAMLLAPELLIAALFGAKYTHGALTLAVLAVGFFAHAVLGLNSNTLTSIGRPRLVMAIQMLSLAVNVALNLLLIPRYGFLGAGIATSASYLLENALYSGSLYWLTGIHPFTGSMLRPAAFVALVTGGSYAVVRSLGPVTPLSLAGVFGLFAIAYVVGVLRLGGVDEEDVRLLDAVEDRSGIDLAPVKSVLRRLS